MDIDNKNQEFDLLVSINEAYRRWGFASSNTFTEERKSNNLQKNKNKIEIKPLVAAEEK